MTMAARGGRARVKSIQNANETEKFFGRDNGDFLLDKVFLIAGDDEVNLHCLGGIELNVVFKFRHRGIKRLKDYLARQGDDFQTMKTLMSICTFIFPIDALDGVDNQILVRNIGGNINHTTNQFKKLRSRDGYVGILSPKFFFGRQRFSGRC